MMRLDAMLERLPPVLDIRPGGLLHGFLAVFANALTAFDEDMDRVQRAHWVDSAFDLKDLGKIGALFGIAPAEWEGLELFRTRLKAMIAGRLHGSVTPDVIEAVVLDILNGVRDELGDIYIDLPPDVEIGDRVLARGDAATRPDNPHGSFIEFPERRARSPELAAGGALRQSLARFDLINLGLEPAALLGRIVGVSGARTGHPAIVNLTTGSILLYADLLECGQTLELGLDPQGRLTGRIGERDVSDRLWTGEGFVAGSRFQPVSPDPEPQPIRLAQGRNEMWFFPLGVFDARGLDSAVFASPKADMRQGRFGGMTDASGTNYDQSLFVQAPAVSLDLWWTERSPAAFRIEIPADVVRRKPTVPARDLDADRTRLFALLQDVVTDMKAAGVDGRIVPRPLREQQRLRSRATVVNPRSTHETQRLESTLSGVSALFDLTAVDGARLE